MHSSVSRAFCSYILALLPDADHFMDYKTSGIKVFAGSVITFLLICTGRVSDQHTGTTTSSLGKLFHSVIPRMDLSAMNLRRLRGRILLRPRNRIRAALYRYFFLLLTNTGHVISRTMVEFSSSKQNQLHYYKSYY
jgi:hypothetical protein